MKIASILILWSVASLHAGEPARHRASPRHRPTVKAYWDRGVADDPARDDSGSLFWEENEDDDALDDDAPPPWGFVHRAAVGLGDPGAPMPGRRTGYVPSRSASPTLRLRC